MKSLNVELFNPAQPEHGQDVTLSITHSGYTPDNVGDVEIYMQPCEYVAYLTITDNEGGEACYLITSSTPIEGGIFHELIASLQNRIIDLFGE